MKFILTIDTEGDNQWDHGRDLTTQNVRNIPRLQNLCEKYKIKPTYLVTSEICKDHFAKDLLSEYINSARAEVGAHLHSWTTPPFRDLDGYRWNDRNHTFAHELPRQFLTEKIEILTDQIEVAFGKRPFSFRSGRFGFNEHVAEILADKHYLVDSSVTPFKNWAQFKGLPDGNGGPDFMEFTPLPFVYKFTNRSLIEIPVTILPTKFPLDKSDSLARSYFKHVDNNPLLKVVRKLHLKHQPVWLRPNKWMNKDLYEDIIREADRRFLPFVVMMFHSSELMPGCSIYWQTKSDVDRLFDLLESIFDFLRLRSIESVTLTEAAESFRI